LDIEDRHLRQVAALASLGSFSGAARSIGMTQPALTRSIQNLERILGGVLFERHRRGVTPTPLGERFVEHALAVLRGLADLEHEVALLRGAGEGVVRVGSGPWPSAMLVPRAVARLCDRWPRLRVDVVASSPVRLIRSLLDREIDLFVGECGAAESDGRFDFALLTPEEGRWVCRAGHPLLERESIAIADLAEFVLATPSGPIPATVDLRAFSHAGWILCENLSVLCRIVLESNAVSLQSFRTAPLELATGALRELPLPSVMLQGRLGIVWVKDRPMAPAAAKLVEELRAVDAALVADDAAAAAAAAPSD
jgi:DNA-binding transcriptional LysR family regulator